MSGRAALLLSLYRGTLTVLEPAAAGLLAWRQRRGKEDPQRIGERRGFATRRRPEGAPLAWLHGASVGETLGLVPIVERLTQRGLAVLVTSGTRTSAELLARRLPAGASIWTSKRSGTADGASGAPVGNVEPPNVKRLGSVSKRRP